jgi:hypothetical protein
MWSPSTVRRRSGQIPANHRPGPAGRGRGSTLVSLGVDSWAWLGREKAAEVGHRWSVSVAAAGVLGRDRGTDRRVRRRDSGPRCPRRGSSAT